MGLHINQIKSKVYYSRDVTNEDQIVSILGMVKDTFLVKYLDVRLCADYIHASECMALSE